MKKNIFNHKNQRHQRSEILQLSSYEEIKKSVALSYEPEKDIAPKIVAKGKGYIAEKIIEVAKQNGIPLYEDKTLVNLLMYVDLDDIIPTQLYKVVAEVLAFIYKLENYAKR